MHSAVPRLLIVAVDGATTDRAIRDHRHLGWAVVTAIDGPTAVAQAMLVDFDLVRLSSGLPLMDTPAVATRITRISGSRGRVPLLVDPETSSIPVRFARGDPAEADVTPDPLARLKPLLGRDAATGLLDRFRDRLDALLDAVDPYGLGEGTTPEKLGHRIGGLAGTLGFRDLADAWLTVERDGPTHLAAAWDESRIARAMLAILLASPA